jgi:hypothetical protein
LWDLTPLLRVLGAVSSDVDVPVVIVSALPPHGTLWPLITSSFNNPDLADVECVSSTKATGAMPRTLPRAHGSACGTHTNLSLGSALQFDA